MIDYKKYKVWEKAHAFVLKTYALTANFPKSEMFNVTSQINRAAVSIPANIAEGCGYSEDILEVRKRRAALTRK